MPASLTRLAIAFILCCGFLSSALAQAPAQDKPAPDVKDEKYGPHERNVVDLWKAKSDAPTPLVIYIHGGGFRAGDKSSLSAPLLRGLLDAGISVAAINYRLSQQATYPAPFMDSARAVQFLRSKAKEWNLDPKRFGATGGSAGAGISLWLGFHDDLADPKAEDPVLRESTRLTCMAVNGAQSSYDPRFIKKVVGGRAHEHPALAQLYGLKPDELDTPKAHAMYEDAASINHLSKDDVPVIAFYNEPKGALPADAKPGQGIHHINFGIALKEKMDALGIECTIHHVSDLPKGAGGQGGETLAFFKKHLLKQPALK